MTGPKLLGRLLSLFLALFAIGGCTEKSVHYHYHYLDAGAKEYEQGHYDKAEKAFSLAVKEDQTSGASDLQLATSLRCLAAVYRMQGKYLQAAPLFNRVLSISEKEFGLHNPNVAACFNDLGALYYSQGHYTEAESVYKRALDIYEHPSVDVILLNLTGSYRIHDHAIGFSNLGNLYLKEGKYADAEPLLKRALAIREKEFGPNDPKVAESLYGLALLYSAQGKYSYAEPLYKRALAMQEKSPLKYHPIVADSLNNLATRYTKDGEYAQAEPLYKRSLQIAEKMLGPNDLCVATILENYAVLLRKTERSTEAARLEVKAKTVRAQKE